MGNKRSGREYSIASYSSNTFACCPLRFLATDTTSHTILLHPTLKYSNVHSSFIGYRLLSLVWARNSVASILIMVVSLDSLVVRLG